MPETMLDLPDGAWTHISNYARATISDSDDEGRIKYAISFLVALHQHLKSAESKNGLEGLVSIIAKDVVRRYQDQSKSSVINKESMTKYGKTVEMLLERFGSILDREESFNQVEFSILIVRPSNLMLLNFHSSLTTF